MKSGLLYVGAALCFATVTAIPLTARADTKLALDLDFAVAVDEAGVDSGTGGALRLGQELDLVILSLTPEIGGSYHTFAGDISLQHYGGFIGGRVQFGKIIEPGVFAHVGIGRISSDGPSETGPTLDAGVFLDFTLLPILDIGVHGAYNALFVEDGNAFDWMRFGAHASLGF